MKRKISAIDVNDEGKLSGDNRCKRLEYWGIQSSYLIHYIGDHEIFKPFGHQNCKKSCKPLVRSAPHIKEKIAIHSFVCHYKIRITIYIYLFRLYVKIN